MSDYLDRVKQAIDIGISYGPIDGAHHKMWAIDQMLRVLLADEYEPAIKAYKSGAKYKSDLLELDAEGEEFEPDGEDDEPEDIYPWDDGTTP